MSQLYCTKELGNGKYLTEIDRYQLEALLKQKVQKCNIAKALKKSVRTINRELQRGIIEIKDSQWRDVKMYCADVAQRKHEENTANKGPSLKIGKDHELARHIEKKIKEEKFSPDAVIGEIKAKGKKFKTSICTKTVYNYIDKDIFLGISNKDLPVKCKGNKKRYRKRTVALNNIKGQSIEKRPKEVEERKEYGHWEMDCVAGGKKGSKAVLLVLSERKTREEIILKMKDKCQKSVISKLNMLERRYRKEFSNKFKTITVDNGVEFLNYQLMEQSIRNKKKRTQIYYAHPYSSWERGTNENTNKLIRRFIPKGADIDGYTDEDIKRIQHWINNYPRRIFNYKSSNDMLNQAA